MKVKELTPQPLWEIFETISHIPHPSHHLEQITAYVVEFGKKLGLETLTDEVGNILIIHHQKVGAGLKTGLPVEVPANSGVCHFSALAG